MRERHMALLQHFSIQSIALLPQLDDEESSNDFMRSLLKGF